MNNGNDKYVRSQHFKDLRELHRLYDKHEPARIIAPGGQLLHPSVAVCACGKLLHDTPSGWKPITHADKRKLRRIPAVLQALREGK